MQLTFDILNRHFKHRLIGLPDRFQVFFLWAFRLCTYRHFQPCKVLPEERKAKPFTGFTSCRICNMKTAYQIFKELYFMVNEST